MDMLTAGIIKNQRFALRCITQPRHVITMHIISELIRNHLSVFLIAFISVCLFLCNPHKMKRVVIIRIMIFVAMGIIMIFVYEKGKPTLWLSSFQFRRPNSTMRNTIRAKQSQAIVLTFNYLFTCLVYKSAFSRRPVCHLENDHR